jgi:hypothetical protein
MSKVVERVARAMVARIKSEGSCWIGYDDQDGEVALEQVTLDGDVDMLAIARAAIEAMIDEALKD